MNNINNHDERIAKMTFASVYPHYINKVEKKGRNKEELDSVIEWLTGYDQEKLKKAIDEKQSFETFFKQARINPNAELITGIICGYRVEEIKNKLTQQVRYLDKLVDELAKGRKMEKILRVAENTVIRVLSPNKTICIERNVPQFTGVPMVSGTLERARI